MTLYPADKRIMHFRISQPNVFYRNVRSVTAHSQAEILTLAPAKMELCLFLLFQAATSNPVQNLQQVFSSLCKTTALQLPFLFLSFSSQCCCLGIKHSQAPHIHSSTSKLETAALAVLSINSIVREKPHTSILNTVDNLQGYHVSWIKW